MTSIKYKVGTYKWAGRVVHEALRKVGRGPWQHLADCHSEEHALKVIDDRKAQDAPLLKRRKS